MPQDDFAFMSVVELAAAIREKKISPIELTKALLARIEKVNPRLNAFVTIPSEQALCSAAKAEDAVMRGDRLGPFHGVPFHVKDNLYVAGSRTTFGSKLFEMNVTAEDCPAVRRLRTAGMIMIGRTNTPEFGWKGVTDNRLFGIRPAPESVSVCQVVGLRKRIDFDAGEVLRHRSACIPDARLSGPSLRSFSMAPSN